MVVSSTALLMTFSKQKSPINQIFKNHDSPSPNPNQNLRSCLHSGKRKERKKKKRMQFAENVKDTKGNGDEYRTEKENCSFGRKENKGESNTRRIDRICKNEITGIYGMPANRIALYNRILRDRVQRIQCSY